MSTPPKCPRCGTLLDSRVKTKVKVEMGSGQLHTTPRCIELQAVHDQIERDEKLQLFPDLVVAAEILLEMILSGDARMDMIEEQVLPVLQKAGSPMVVTLVQQPVQDESPEEV